jgi:hypothetical protein
MKRDDLMSAILFRDYFKQSLIMSETYFFLMRSVFVTSINRINKKNSGKIREENVLYCYILPNTYNYQLISINVNKYQRMKCYYISI